MGGIAVLIVVVGAIFLMKQPATEAPSQPVDSQSLLREGTHMTQNKDSKVTIVEFGDFQCPACEAAFPTVEQTLAKYKDNKDVNFAFRNFPLPQHQNAQVAAEAAEAAGAQGKYWEMYRRLYETQKDWELLSNAAALDKYVGFAQELGLDVNRFKSEVQANKYAEIISADQNDGLTLGVDSTPTFFINGQKQVGMNSGNFTKAIEDALAK